MTQESRAHHRIEYQLPVKILTDQASLDGTTINLSLGGMFVYVGQSLPFGTMVELHMQLPGLEEPTHTKAIVRWERDGGLGLQFEGLRAREVWALNQLFKSLEASPA